MHYFTNSIRFSAKSILLSLGLITLVACGGGGGGGYPAVSYQGNNNQATVSETNANDFPITMLEGSTRIESVNTADSIGSDNPPSTSGIISSSETSTSNAKAQRSTVIFSSTNIIKNSILSTLSNKSDNASIAAAAAFTMNGTCANPGTSTWTDNSANNTASGDITFNNFCVGDDTESVTVHGKITYSGSYFLDGSSNVVLNTLSMNMIYLKVTTTGPGITGIYSEEFSGTFTANSFDLNNDVTSISFSAVFDVGGETYKVENLTFDNTGGQLNLSGRFYHPVHGYVEATTTTPFTQIFGTEKYCGGSLQITGNGGTIDFTDSSPGSDCSTYDICFTPTGGAQTCNTNVAWP